jgi:hypothetical protein
MTKPKPPKPVSRAEKAFYEAQDALNEFKENHEEFMTELMDLVSARERARERLLAAVSDHKFGAGGMRVSLSTPRTFNADYLYRSLPEKIRDEIITTKYKVDYKKFDRAVKSGLIDEDVADKAFTREDEKVTVLNKINPINIG